MSKKQDIGFFIKNKLKEAKKAPDNAIWDKINSTLDKENKKKLFYRKIIGSIVAISLLLLLFTTNHSLFNKNNTQLDSNHTENTHNTTKSGNNDFINTTTQKTDEEEGLSHMDISGRETSVASNEKGLTTPGEKNSIYDRKKNIQERITTAKTPIDKAATDKDKKNIIVNANKAVRSGKAPSDGNDYELPVTEESTLSDNETVTNLIVSGIENEDAVTASTLEKANEENNDEKITDSLSEEEPEEEPTETPENKRLVWGISLVGAPTFHQPFNSSGSIIDFRLDDHKTSGQVNFTYGVAVNAYLSERLSISYGINRTKLNYLTKDIAAESETDLGRILSFSALNQNATINATELANFTSGVQKVDLLQEIDYFELPLQFTYKLSTSQTGFQFIAGFSTLLLNENAFYVQNSGSNRLKIGEADNLSRVNFSLNAGVGFYYNISRRITAEINPTFKYFILTNSNRNTGFNNYQIGAFTVLTYRLQ